MKKISPMLAKDAKKPFDREGWLYEMKWDGYRAIATKNREIQLISRGQKSFNARYPAIVNELKKISGKFIVDGEIVLLDQKGKPNFQLLQNYQRFPEGTLCYYIFDILSFNGKDVHQLPLIERKKILKKIIPSRCKHIKFGDFIEKNGIAFFKEVKKLGLEGIMAKRKDSPYQFRRSSDWLKIKTKKRQEVVIGGYTEPKGSRQFFGALLIGVYEKKKLIYAGHVGGGFDERLLKEIYSQLKKMETDQCPFSEEPKPNTPVHWIQPKLVCEVEFSEWTKDGILRQPIFKGMRDDKQPLLITREQ